MEEKNLQQELDALDAEVQKQKMEADELFLELLLRYRIDAASEYAEKEYLLERESVGFSPRGNVCALSAEKKAGKTWFAMAMCSAFLSGQYLGMKSRVDGGKVVFFDTEQDEGDGQRIMRRVHYACGWDFRQNNDRFQLFHLREIDAKERRDFVCKAIEYIKPDLVIVDGIRDLLSDFNDLEQSAALIQDFMRLSSEYKCAIWAVLHVNPNSEKMRGHLGTELGNKVADILYMTKDKNPRDEDDVTYKMEEVAARSHKDIRSINFKIDDSVPYGAPVMMTENEVNSKKVEYFNMLKDFFKSLDFKPNGKSWTELDDNMRLKSGIKSNRKLQTMIDDAISFGFLKKDNKRYYFNEYICFGGM